MPSRARAYWKGYLRLSLVSIGVELYPAGTSADGTALHQIHKPSGKRVRYEKVVPGLGPVDADDIVKGFEIGEESYVLIEPEELDAIKLESSRSIELTQFVDRAEIDPRYFEKPYYVVPEGGVSTEGLIVLREALRSAGKIGLAKLTMRGRENLVAVMPFDKGLLLETLRYGDELRAAADYFEDIGAAKIDKEMVSLASELIQRKAKAFDPSAFHDSYAAAMEELVERKRAGRAIVHIGDEERRPPGKVIDLIEALKRSVGEGAERRTARKPREEPETRPPSRKKAPARPAKASSARRRA